MIPLRLTGWFACALMASSSASASGEDGSGVQGLISLSPTCGGPQREGDTPCKAPYEGAELRLLSGSGATVATARTTSDGRYLLSAPAGHYRVVVMTPIRITRCQSPDVVVTEKKFSVVDIECDSGMR